MKYYRAAQTFTGEYPDDGAPYFVGQGEVRPEGDRAVRHDLKNGGVNFKLLEDAEGEPKAKATAPRIVTRGAKGAS